MALARAKVGGLFLAICLGAETQTAAQTALSQLGSSGVATGALTGKLTDVRSAPLAGVTVIVRNSATGAERRTTTGKNGAYRFVGLAAGEYTIEAESERLGRGQLEGIEVGAGHEARVQAAMQFEPPSAQAANEAIAATPAETAITTPAPSAPPSTQLAVVAGDVAASAHDQATPQPNIDAAGFAPHAALSTVSPSTDSVVPEQSLQLARLGDQPIASAAAGAALRSIQPAAVAPMLAMSVGAALGAEAAITTSALSAIAAAAEAGGPATPAVTTEVSGAELQALPASGRQWQEFVLDTPASSAAAGSAQASLRGAGQDAADTTVDGASTRLAFGGAAGSEPSSEDIDSAAPKESGAREGWPGGPGVGLSEAAISAVTIEAGNVEARGARAAG